MRSGGEQGQAILEEEDRLIAALAGTAFVVELGGLTGRAAGWGRCLAVRPGDAASIRSRLGNVVAEESARRGLRAMAAVVYSEVRPCACRANLRVGSLFRGVRTSTFCKRIPPKQANSALQKFPKRTLPSFPNCALSNFACAHLQVFAGLQPQHFQART